jgi:hypothetical protein
MTKLPDYGDHMKLSKFIEHCKSGTFIDYDGFGYYATETEMTDILIMPSHVTGKRKRVRKDYDYVMWFNR